MPELPEVETTRRGLAPHLLGKTVSAVVVRNPRLRWPVPEQLPELLQGERLLEINRRAKYLLFRFKRGHLLLHLGMSGNLRLVAPDLAAKQHEHWDMLFDNRVLLRYTDPRRFGACLWLGEETDSHPLLAHLGPEPLSVAFAGDWLYQRSRGRSATVKQFIMDQQVVVGVGNIYANEALFASGIRPTNAAGKISLARYRRLAEHIREILQRAIDQGGTTLRDFIGGDGKPGYFQQQLYVYGRAGQPCKHCQRPLSEVRLSGRSTVYCGQCQR